LTAGLRRDSGAPRSRAEGAERIRVPPPAGGARTFDG